ncbi:ABC transporter permease [Mesorhizobium sp. 1B3]|uniref:ABC transporter permease n=1 Tax=Mesorhizobium sp. 1B3 TaxID=3243599 RepID=UPI003D9803FD
MSARYNSSQVANAFLDTEWKEAVPFIDRIPQPVSLLCFSLILVLIWQAITWTGLISPILLPTPRETFADMLFVGLNLVSGQYMLLALLTTLQELLVSFFLAILIGSVLGLVVGETHFGERVVMPHLVALDNMPKIALAPLFIAWLGFGIASKVALATFIAVFPIVVATAAGLHAAGENERMLLKSIGASRWQTLVKMKLPAGLPHFFTGLKIASVGVMAGAIAGEFLGGGKGFGNLIHTASTQLAMPRVFSLIIYLSLLGLALFASVDWVQRRVVFWQRESLAGRDQN